METVQEDTSQHLIAWREVAPAVWIGTYSPTVGAEPVAIAEATVNRDKTHYQWHLEVQGGPPHSGTNTTIFGVISQVQEAYEEFLKKVS